MTRFENDTTLTVESCRIKSYETVKASFEGHYMHYNTALEAKTADIPFAKGDYFVQTHQPALRYLLETLELQAPDSLFNWNFFEAIFTTKRRFFALFLERFSFRAP